MPNWKQIKAEYVRGSISLRELAEKHGVSFSTIQHKCAEEKWTDLKQKICRKAEEKAIESAAAKKAKTEVLFDTITDMLLEKIEAGLKDNSLLLSGRGIRDITGALKDIREIKGYKSDLDVQEQMARIEKLKKDTQEDNTDKSITVKFADSLDDYAD